MGWHGGGGRGRDPQAEPRRRRERKRDLETGLVKTPVGNAVRDTPRQRQGGDAWGQRETSVPDVTPRGRMPQAG